MSITIETAIATICSMSAMQPNNLRELIQQADRGELSTMTATEMKNIAAEAHRAKTDLKAAENKLNEISQVCCLPRTSTTHQAQVIAIMTILLREGATNG